MLNKNRDGPSKIGAVDMQLLLKPCDIESINAWQICLEFSDLKQH